MAYQRQERWDALIGCDLIPSFIVNWVKHCSELQ